MRSIRKIFESLKSSIIYEFRKVGGGDIIDQNFGIENPIALAHAAEIRSIEHLIREVARQSNPLTADSKEDSEIGMLEYLGELKEIFRKQATAGKYKLRFKIIDNEAVGEIPAGTTFTASNGINLISTKGISFSPGDEKIDVEAQNVLFGSANILFHNATVLFNTSVPGIDQDGKVIEIESVPTDAEDVEVYRDKVISAWNIIPRGGTAADYRMWATEVKEIKNAFPVSTIRNCTLPDNLRSANLGLGFPTIYLEFYENVKDNPKAIEDYIEILSKKAPLCAGNVIVKPCDIKSIRVEVGGFISNEGKNKDEYISEIKNTIDEYLSNIRPYIAAVDKVKNNEISKSVLQAKIMMALSNKAYFSKIEMFKCDNSDKEVDSYTLSNSEYFVALEPVIL